MGVYKKEDILGYETDQGFYCEEHLPKGAQISDVLTEDNRDDDLIYICDHCHKEI
jgi:hypothetical protein